MNIFTLINRGAQHANILQTRAADREKASLEEARVMWLNALLVDETRAWLEIGQSSREVLNGLTTLLVLAGMALAHDAREVDTVAHRIIRGAMSAAEQCERADCVITMEHARAFSVAAERAGQILRECSTGAIAAAAVGMRETVGLAS